MAKGQGDFFRGLTKGNLEQLERDAAIGRKLQQQELIKPFVDALGSAMLTLLATTPYSEWPQMAKHAFDHVKQDFPYPARMYKDLLPKP